MRTIEITIAVVLVLLFAAFFVLYPHDHAQRVGSVNTAFKLIGPDHKIVIESYDDPKVDGVTVFVSEARTGGVKGGLGLAQDTLRRRHRGASDRSHPCEGRIR